MPLVVDASAILPLALPDEDALYSNAVLRQLSLDGIGYAPPIFWDEVANVLVLAVRDGRIDLALAERFLLKASHDLPLLTVTPPGRLSILHTAHEYGLTSYDASYLALGIDKSAELATHDGQLIAAAKRAGVERFCPG